MNNELKKNAELSINTIRVLSCEMITQAKSGHPGIALGAAPIMYAIYKDHLVANVNNNFLGRDKLILSAGHGSALLYSTMHLAGYKSITLDDLKKFRKINSKTAGHPETDLIEGIDASTGPLGQGVGLAVGMAIAETKLNAYFKEYDLVDSYTYCVFGDGCFQEGISYEAFTIAAKLKLNKLIYIYDSNDVQLEGRVKDSTLTENKKYFESLGLNYILVTNGNDYAEISKAITEAKKSKYKPTVIEVKTKIGYGSVHEDSFKAHGSALSEEQLSLLKEKLNYKNDKFVIDSKVYDDFNEFKERGEKALKQFNEKVSLIKSKDSNKYAVLENILNRKISKVSFEKNYSKTKDSTRNISGNVVSKICESNQLITLISPDISSSTKIIYPNGGTYSAENRLGININLGVREFLMGTIINGISSTGLKAMGSTFLPFSDYCKSAIRLSAISKNPGVFVFSHDSIAVGEDGPTHQAIEQIWGLRLIPNHIVLRPSNYEETAEAFEIALNSSEHCYSIITSRQEFELPVSTNIDVSKGAYIIGEKDNNNNVNIIATGAEVSIALEVKKILLSKNIKANVISMVSVELFNKQSNEYKTSIINSKPTVSIEFGSSLPWKALAELNIGIDRYGLSGPYEDILKEFKITPTDIANKIEKFIK